VTTAPAHSRADPDSDPSPDRLLLRAFEPVLRFTDGELFLPTAVDRYVARCSLWVGGPRRSPAPLVPAGGLTLDRLADLGAQFRDRPLYLRLVQQQLTRSQVRTWRRQTRPRLRSTARLAAVGVLARLVDVVLRLSLLVRGRVPRGHVAAAESATRADAAVDGRPYYGRVVVEAGYTVLQYWYFYAFNDWRSTFHGVNDHEADWETVAVYLAGTGTAATPAWVAASSHDHDGAVLRRRWDDPELSREGDHPVLHPGAGSHSGAFVAGDYVVSVELPALRRLLDRLRRRGRPAHTHGFAVPFVDYARGDGVAVGPGHDLVWHTETIDDATPWVRGFRGLWGLDTRDPLGGERAPAGPRYERGGTVRRAWADPLGWAGLATVAPTAAEERAALRARLGEIGTRVRALDEEIQSERTALRGLRAQARSLADNADTRGLQQQRVAELGVREAALTALTAERSRLTEEDGAHTAALTRPLDAGPPDAHLRGLSPARTVDEHPARLRLWAAVSSPVLLCWIGLLLFWPTALTLSGFAIFLVLFAGVEAFARGRTRVALAVLSLAVVGVGAVTGLVVALLRNWQLGVAVLCVLAALGLLVLNLHELLARPGADRPGAGDPLR
jgi:hypothetical protein